MCYHYMQENFLTTANHTEILNKKKPKQTHSEFVLPQRMHIDMHVEWRVHRIWNVDT